MTSKAIIFGVGLPMVIFGAFIALAIAPLAEGVVSTIEFVGSLIGILGVVFMISGMFYKKEIIIQDFCRNVKTGPNSVTLQVTPTNSSQADTLQVLIIDFLTVSVFLIFPEVFFLTVDAFPSIS